MPRLDKDGEQFVVHVDPDDEVRLDSGWLNSAEPALPEAAITRAIAGQSKPTRAAIKETLHAEPLAALRAR
jgi:hypothetical protein